MTVAHLGPPPAQGGGPAGYLQQLERALAAPGDSTHQVLFPRAVVPHRADAQARPAPWPLTLLRRARRTWWRAPRQFRAPEADLTRVDGVASAQVAAVWADLQARAAASIRQAKDAAADVWFAHDAPTAERALAERPPGSQVWLLMHTPMPLALYLVWCWGVCEALWETVWAYPDVQAWAARERAVMQAVDRLIVPTPEAGDELARVDPELRRSLEAATFLMTGASRDVGRAIANTTGTHRHRWGLPADVPVVLFLGNAQPYRGLDLLLSALPHLEGAPPGLLAVAGCPVDALPFHARLRALGSVRDVPDLLAAVDAVVNVNRFSLFDLSTIEACEAGRLLMLSRAGGNRSFERLGAGCRMLRSSDPRGIAEGLAHVFAMPPAERRELGRQSRVCYESHLTPGHLRSRHLALYDMAAADRFVGHA